MFITYIKLYEIINTTNIHFMSALCFRAQYQLLVPLIAPVPETKKFTNSNIYNEEIKFNPNGICATRS